VPAVAVELPPLHSYDELIGGADVELAAHTDEVVA
jgi:hypothetical protein